jgi:tRNA G18 (ribose-2'-O)-methylase SpoU
VAHIVPIERVNAPEIAAYVGVRERDLARGFGDGLFVAEGEVVVRMLVRQRRFPVRSLLIEQRRASSLGDVLAQLAPEIPVYVADQKIMDAVVGFAIHRGILALGERGKPLEPSEILIPPPAAGPPAPVTSEVEGRLPLVVGLVGLANHDNVGAIFRNAAAFGAAGVLLDPSTCDPLYRKAIRVSVGAALHVPFARCASAQTMLDLIESSGWDVFSLTGSGEESVGTALVRPTSARGRVLLLGTEGEGLPDDVLGRTLRVRIDMSPTMDSLNVAVASGIALYECNRR